MNPPAAPVVPLMRGWPARRDRGVLIVIAMLLAGLMAIALVTYIRLSTNSLRLANRSFYNNAALNLAETGIEEALYCFNQVNAGTAIATAWTDWDTSDGTTAKRTFSGFSFGGSTTGSVKVYVSAYNPSGSTSPRLVAKATITVPNQVTLSKYVEVTLKRRSLFATGLVARNTITFAGNNAAVDSWISDPDNDPSTAAVAYSSSNKRDHGSVGSVAVDSTIDVQNADIWGYAAVGGPSSSSISVGSQGRVGPFGTASGVKNPDNIATDFTANLDNVSLPTTGTAIGYVGSWLGSTGSTYTFRYAGTINNSLTIYGNVTLILTAPAGSSAISLTGSDQLTLAPGATLTIYTAGDVKIAGNGLLNNNNDPSTFQLWGTSTSASAQSIQIAGNGALKGIVYAPNGSIKINGNGDVMGSVVGNDITVVGNAAFHYDESLANFGGNTPYGPSGWRELISAADRSAYASQLSF